MSKSGFRVIDAPRRSWPRWFAERVRHRRIVAWFQRLGDDHLARSWALALRRPDLADVPGSHATWLTADAIAYRRAIGRPEPFL